VQLAVISMATFTPTMMLTFLDVPGRVRLLRMKHLVEAVKGGRNVGLRRTRKSRPFRR
jgi:hypothetical protein